jgi:hypothetical protein
MKRALAGMVLSMGLMFSGLAAADPPACVTTQPRSCDNWSGYYEVATQCISTKFCDGEWYPTIIHATRSQQQQFRVCSYSDGTQCKETQTQYVVTECGCY